MVASAVIVSRPQSELPTRKEIDWVREMSVRHDRVMLLVPASFLARAISKLRNPKRYDYADDKLGQRMDTFVRSYLELPQTSSFRKPKKR